MGTRTILLGLATLATLVGRIQAEGPIFPDRPAYDEVASPSSRPVLLSESRLAMAEPAATPGEVAVRTQIVPEPLTTSGPEPLFGSYGEGSCNSKGNGNCPEDWNFKVVPYGWLYEMHGGTVIHGVPADVNISTRKMLDILEDDVDFVIMGRMESQKGPFTVLFDGYYVKAGVGNDISHFNFNAQFEQAIVELSGAYEIECMPALLSLPPCSKFEVLAGARYELLKGGATISGPFGGSANFNGTQEWVDPIVGGRIIAPLYPSTTVQVRGDVGGFGWGDASEFTWNFEAIAQYEFAKGCNLMAGYRILDIDYRQGNGNNRFVFDVQFRGPVAGIEFVY